MKRLSQISVISASYFLRRSIIDADALNHPPLAKHAKTRFSGGSAEYRKAREPLPAEEIEFAAT